MILSRQERFWRWLRDYAQRMMHEAWMSRRKHDRKCPNCKRWFGDAGGWDSLTDETAMIERITCEACGHTSRWWCGNMMPVHIPAEGAGTLAAASLSSSAIPISNKEKTDG